MFRHIINVFKGSQISVILNEMNSEILRFRFYNLSAHYYKKNQSIEDQLEGLKPF
jgi:hypothetical protein